MSEVVVLAEGKKCLNCGVLFSPKRHPEWVKFCSDRCRKRYFYLHKKEAKKRVLDASESSPNGRKYY